MNQIWQQRKTESTSSSTGLKNSNAWCLPTEMIGKTLSHYKIIEKIGQGGMGEVYRAEDTNLSREVAIKVLPDFLKKDPTAKKRFLREAKSAATSKMGSLIFLLLALLCTPTEVNKLFAQGDVSFIARRTFGVGDGPVSVTVGDFNGDTIQDLAVANNSSANVSILLGQGDGTFLAAQNFGVGNGPLSVTVGDFNGDTIQDLATANHGSANVSILLGQGDGTFLAAQNFGLVDTPHSMTVGDFNGDTIQDLAVAIGEGQGLGAVSVFLGRGDGTFLSAQHFGVGGNPNSVTVGDFNGDSIQDLAVANSSSANVSILLGQGDGTFLSAQNFGVGDGPFSVTAGDFNGDSIQDLAVANNLSKNVSILLGPVVGPFLTAQNFGVGDRPTSVTVGDFNGDTIQDLAVANNSSANVSILLGNGDGTFLSAQDFGAGDDPFSVTVGDFNGDSIQDLALTNVLSDNVSILLNNTRAVDSTVLVANFTNSNDGALNSRVYLFNPSQSGGEVTVRVFTLPLIGGLAQELTSAPLSLGTLGARSALNLKLAEDILTLLGIPLPYTDNDGDLALEFTIGAANVRGATQVFSSSLAFGTNPLQEIPSTSSGSPTVLVANFMNGNDAAFNSRVYLFNPSPSAGNMTVRVFTLPLGTGTAQELPGSPLDLGTLGAKSALNVRLAEDILTPLGITTPYITDGGNLTLEFTIQAADVRGAAQVFSSSFAFGVYPMQQIPSTSSGSPTVLVANFMNGNNAAFNSRVYLWNPSQSTGNVTVRVFTLPLSGGTAQELPGSPLDLGPLGAKSALNVKLAEDILTPLGITTPYITDGGNLTLEFTIQAADVRGAAQVFSSSFAFGTNPLQEIPSTSAGSPTVFGCQLYKRQQYGFQLACLSVEPLRERWKRDRPSLYTSPCRRPGSGADRHTAQSGNLRSQVCT